MKLQHVLNTVFVAGILYCASFSASAQGAYVKLGGGYNWGISSQSGYKTVSSSTFNQATNSWHTKEKAERVNVNFGKGFTGNAAFGYMFTEQLGAEIEAGYLAGGKNTTSSQIISENETDASRTYKTEMFARMLIFQPSLVMVTKISDNLHLQGKFGIVTGTGIIYLKNHQLTNSSEYITEGEYKGGWGFGLQGALGLTYKLNTKYALFSEIKMSNLSYAPNTYQLTKQIYNGEDVTDPVHLQEVTLVNSYTNIDFQYRVNIKEAFPFGSVGLNLGLKYNF